MKRTFLASLLIAFAGLQLQAQIIITGIMYDPKGSDAAAAGTAKGLSTNAPHKGGFEYVQFMATEDIDFSKTPYAVVICNNYQDYGSAPENGWAEGGKRTFKFNLTEGKATKGSFFYVGGPEKRIAGYWNKTRSADISNANWIRTIAYSKGNDEIVGDGFGQSTEGLIPNGGNPAGIAVFKGTSVNKDSTPMDVIFIATQKKLTGAAKAITFNSSKGYGYKITDNDLYKTTDTKGKPQPFLAQGSNQQAFLNQLHESLSLTADRANFLMLGGSYNTSTKQWDSNRTTKYITLCPNPDEIPTAKLSDIETGEFVTKLITK